MKKIRMFSSAIVCAALLIGASSALVSCKPSSGGQTTINISGQAEISIQADSLDQDYQYTADQQCTWGVETQDTLVEAITINQVGLLSINPNLSPDTYKFNVTATHGDASSKKEIALTITSATLTGLSISGDDTINRYNYQNEMWNNSHFYTVTPIPQHATLSSIQWTTTNTYEWLHITNSSTTQGVINIDAGTCSTISDYNFTITAKDAFTQIEQDYPIVLNSNPNPDMINFTISGPSSLQTTSTSASTASYSAIGTTPQYAIPGWSWNIDSYSGDYDNFTYSLSETGVLYYAKKYSYTLYSKMIVTIKATSTYTSTVSKTYSVEITAAM